MDLTDRLASERRGRLAAERLLELKSRELFEANRQLSKHALSLSGQIIEQRGEAERLKEHSAQVQADLERAEEHVEIVERRLWDSVETIGDGFAVFDAQDRLIAANTAWLSIFNYSEQIGPGTLYLELLRIAVEEEHVDLQGGTPGDWIGDMLERWDTPDTAPPQEVRLTSGQWYRFIDRRARDGDMVCVAQNITALKDRESELEEARHRAEAANRAKSAFLANMSHELRTPMNGVVAMAEMLLEGEMDDEQRLYVSTIKSSGEALLEIINHVLDFSKMEAERMVLRPEPFDMERLLHEVVTLLGPTARDKKLGLFVDYDLFSPTHLVGDAMRIRQIVINLVGNAVKFTAEGHVLIRVLCHDAGDQGWGMTVTVEDTGIGIPEDMQDHVFGSFAQVESEKNRAFEGTGLGLAITRELVQLMGGEIWVDSQVGEGSCFGFRVTLPAAEPSHRVLPMVDTTIGRALIVAPEGYEAQILGRQLAQLGLDVAQAASGSEALAMAQANPSSQITLIDANLPDTTPPELARALDEAKCPSARVLICNSPQDAAKYAAKPGAVSGPGPAGIHAILTRPMLRSDLFEAIAHLPVSAPLADRGPGPAPSGAHAGAAPEAPSGADRPLPAGPGGPVAASAPGGNREQDAPATDLQRAGAPVPAAREERPPPGPQPAPPEPVRPASAPPGSMSPGSMSPEPVSSEPVSAASAPSPDALAIANVQQPSAPPPDRDAGAGAPATASGRAPEAMRPMRVLAAEDNKTNRFVLSKLLAKLNIDLHFAVDGQEAVEMHESLDPDLILMDISMPRMDGKAAARAIRAREAAAGDGAGDGAGAKAGTGAHVPIVAMTAHALDGDKEEILASGIDHYMTKPLKRAQLTARIVELCPAERAPPLEDAPAPATAAM